MEQNARGKIETQASKIKSGPKVAQHNIHQR